MNRCLWSYTEVNLFNWPDANFMHLSKPIHTAMGAIAYWSSLVLSKKPVGREVAFTQGYGKNPANLSRIGPKFGWHGKVNQKSGRFANVLFHSHVYRKGTSSSGPLSGPVGVYRYAQVYFTY